MEVIRKLQAFKNYTRGKPQREVVGRKMRRELTWRQKQNSGSLWPQKASSLFLTLRDA